MGLYEQPPPGGTADPVRVRAGDAPRSLTAAQIRDTSRLLRPEAVRYAPALGLLLFNAMPFVSNLRWCETLATAMEHDRGLANACMLAEELFFQRERSQPLALTRSRSRVAYYLTPSLLGHILGLASVNPPLSDKQLDEALRGLGVATNKVHGVKTGVSLARWRRVIRLAGPGGTTSSNRRGQETDGIGQQLAIAMLLRVLWERASTKACLATFLTTLDKYTPVLRPADQCFQVDAIRRQQALGTAATALNGDTNGSSGVEAAWRAWLQSSFSADELGACDDIEQAALTLLQLPANSDVDGWEKWASALDRVAASLSQVQVAKPRLTVAKYGYCGLPEKPDCVEVTCREIFDLLLYDPLQQAFVPSRLPRLPGTHPELIAFYEAQLADEDEPALGQRWFDLCSNHAALEYLSPTAGDLAIAAASGSQDGTKTESVISRVEPGYTSQSGDSDVQYELLPTLQNVARTCGTLLGAEDAGRWQHLADLADWWNALPSTKTNCSNGTFPNSTARRKLAVVEEVRSFRAPHGEEMLHRQHALLSLLPAALDSDLEADSRTLGGSFATKPNQPGTSTGRSSDPYDVAFPIKPGAKESDLAAAAAMDAGGGIKLTLEEAHNISAVFHVPAPRPWLRPAQNTHLDNLLGRNVAGNCNTVYVQHNSAANAAISAAVLPALLGGRWLEVPASTDISRAVVSILSARLSKGGELEAATSRAVYLALAVSSSDHIDQMDQVRQRQGYSRAQHERALCVALADRMISELSAAESIARGAESTGSLLPDTQLRLAKAVVAQATQAADTTAAMNGIGTDVLQLKTLPSPGQSQDLPQPLSEQFQISKDCALLDAAVAGWADGWHARHFSGLGWRDRVRLVRFALQAGQRAL